MSKGAKWFTEEEKEIIREKLCLACEHSWRTSGYKKASINELTKSVGISTGAFYAMYPSKEELFLKTILVVRERVKSQIHTIIASKPDRQGVYEAIRYLFKEYNDNAFLYDFSSPDYVALISKLPTGRWEEIQTDNVKFLSSVINTINLDLRVTPQKAHAILATLLYTVTAKDRITEDYFKIFDFLLESVLDKLFEK